MFSFFLDKRWLDLQFNDADRQHIKRIHQLSIDTKQDYPPSTIENDLLDRIQGSMFGLAIGDALGVHVELKPHTYLEANPVTDIEGGGAWTLEKGQVTNESDAQTLDCTHNIARFICLNNNFKCNHFL